MTGVLKGKGSHRARWLDKDRLGKLRGLVFITMWDAVQRDDLPESDGIVTPTFKGHAVIGDDKKRTLLSYRNIKLTPATGCPQGSEGRSSR